MSGADGRVADELVGLVKNQSFPGIGVNDNESDKPKPIEFV